MSRLTPPMGISGAFILRAPFSADANKRYTVVALRTFDELVARKQDPMRLVYEPVGLTATAYSEDQVEGALIVCLRDTSGSMMYVPDTYIDSYPQMGSVKHSRLVLGVSLGMFPDSRDLTDIKQAVIESVASKIGVVPEVFVSRASTSDYVDEQQYAQITQARNNAITNRETATATIIRLTDTIAAQEVTLAEQQLLIESLVAEIDALTGV
ncbi:hypothetical protein D3C85_16100 [compost metagenome]